MQGRSPFIAQGQEPNVNIRNKLESISLIIEQVSLHLHTTIGHLLHIETQCHHRKVIQLIVRHHLHILHKQDNLVLHNKHIHILQIQDNL